MSTAETGERDTWTTFHLRLANGWVNRLVTRQRGRRFVRLFNLRSRLLGRPVRLAFDADAGRYTATPTSSADEPSAGEHHPLPAALLFCHEAQGNLSYQHGLARRAEGLGAVYFLERIDFAEGDVVLDCGANLGDLLLWFRLRGLAVRYTAFEPSPLEHGCLVENVRPHTAHNIGLWNTRGQLSFYVSSQGADSSLIEPAHYDEVIEVPTERLDAYVDGPVKLLKLEAEGAEPEILEGLGEAIAQVEYISADLGFERGKDGREHAGAGAELSVRTPLRAGGHPPRPPVRAVPQHGARRACRRIRHRARPSFRDSVSRRIHLHAHRGVDPRTRLSDDQRRAARRGSASSQACAISTLQSASPRSSRPDRWARSIASTWPRVVEPLAAEPLGGRADPTPTRAASSEASRPPAR